MEELTELKKHYRDIYKRITDLNSSCFNLSMAEAINQLSIESDSETANLNDKLNTLTNQELQEGVLLHDLSGIGLYLLAYAVANSWSLNEVFTSFKAVIIVPIERMYLKKHLNPIQDLRDFLKIWDIDADIKAEELLVIVSGCSARELRNYTTNKDEEASSKKRWFSAIQQHKLPHVLVSNSLEVPYSGLAFKKIYHVSLQGYFLNVDYHCPNVRKTSFSIPGALIIAEAKSAIEQNYFHLKNEQNRIEYTPEWHKQVNAFMQGHDFNTLLITTKHIHPSCTPQELVRTVLAHITQDHTILSKSSTTKEFTTPEEWFCAAITPLNQERKTACYLIAGNLIVRNLANHYVNIVELPNPEVRENPKSFKAQYAPGELSQFVECLTNLTKEAEFDNWDTQEVIQQIKNSVAAKRKELRGDLKKSSNKAIKDLCSTLEKEDPTSTRFLTYFSNDRKSVAYHTIQEDFESEMAAQKNDNVLTHSLSITQLIRQLLSGKKVKAVNNLVLGLSATLLSETKRYPLNFLATLCLFDLIEDSKVEDKYWREFFAHSKHREGHAPNTLEDAIISDIVHTLGGLQAMSHGNSYNQISQNQQPKLGMHWVDFKTHIILINWLSKILSNEKDINPYLTGQLSTTSREHQIDDLLLNFIKTKISHANPYLFDRFSRRLDNFTLLISPKPAVRELASGSSERVYEFLIAENFAHAIRAGLPDFKSRHLVNKQTLFYTIAKRFQLGVANTKFASGISTVKMVNDKRIVSTHNSLRQIARYRCELLLTALEIDPLFYDLHYHVAHLFLFELQDAQLTLEELGNYFKHASINDGDLFFYAMSLKLRCHFIMSDYEQFDKDASYYFTHYHNPRDENFWRMHCLRALINSKRYPDNPMAFIHDLYLFLDHTPQDMTPDYTNALEVLDLYDADFRQVRGSNLEEFKLKLGRITNQLHIHGCDLYLHQRGFFSPSKYAHAQQPYGPYKDHYCHKDSIAVQLASSLNIPAPVVSPAILAPKQYSFFNKGSIAVALSAIATLTAAVYMAMK